MSRPSPAADGPRRPAASATSAVGGPGLDHTRASRTAERLKLLGLGLLFLAALLLSSVSFAEEDRYVCSITEFWSLAEDGTLKPVPAPWPIGKRFLVDRRNGVIAGPDASPWTTPDSKFAAFAKGDRQGPFVGMAMTPGKTGGVPALSTIVNEQQPGPRKTFVLSTGTQVATGTCE